jgi:hypothetical protein
VLSLPFAHSATFDENMLLVATGNPAANQAAGQPGIQPYLITRNGQTLTFTAQSQLLAVSPSYGYKAVGRVARAQDRLIGGWAGDASRLGGQGLVSVWKKNAAGTGWVATPAQEFTASGAAPGVNRFDRFGFALATEGTVLVVGAPRDDTAAPQAGKIYLYSWNGTTYVKTQEIVSPDAENEAGFGSALAMKGNKMLVGAPGVTQGTTLQAGAVYVYARRGGTWEFVRKLRRPADSLSGFGIEVAMNDTWLAAASRVSNPNSNLNARVSLESVAGIYDWHVANTLPWPPASLLADEDADGVTNLVEYACNLNPHLNDHSFYADGGGSGLPLVALDQASHDGSLLVSYLRPLADSLLAASVETGSQLSALSPATVEPVASSTAGTILVTTVRVRPSPGATKFFARVRYSYAL